MREFINKIQMVIESNAELNNSKVLRAVLENIKFENNMQFLTDLKEGLTDVNQYMNNSDLSSIINSVDDKIEDEKKNDVDGYIDACCNEFDVNGLCDKVKAEVQSEPELTTCLNDIQKDCQTSKRPSYLYLNSLSGLLDKYKDYDAVRNAQDEINNYVNDNQEKLCVLDTIKYADSMGGYCMNPSAVSTLKQSVVDNEYNPEVLAIRLGESVNNASIINMLSTLRGIRASKGINTFDLGQSNGETKVYNYVGPVLREGKNVTFYVDNTFIKITPEKQSGVARVISEGKVNVYEISDLDVFDKNSKFYGAVKAFESLGFHLTNNGVTTKLSHSTVDFKLNENQCLDFFINGKKVTNVDEAKKNESLVVESTTAKSCLYTILENVSNIYNMPFVKFMINEKRGASSMIFNIGNEYFVYDYVSESKTDVYKMNAYKLYEFCLNKFGFDVSNVFEMSIKDVRKDIAKIEEQKAEINKKIEEYKEAYNKLNEATYTDLNEEDRKDVESLKDVLFGGMNDLKSNYEKLCKASDALRFAKPIKESEECNECGDNGSTENGDNSSNQPIEGTVNEEGEGTDYTVIESLESTNEDNQIIKCPKCGQAHERDAKCEEVKPEGQVNENEDFQTETTDITDTEKKNDIPVDDTEIKEDYDKVVESFGPTHYFEDDDYVLGVKFNQDGTQAQVLEGAYTSDWVSVDFGKNKKGEDSLIIDSRGYNICVEDLKPVNEGFLDAMKTVGKGLGKVGKGIGKAAMGALGGALTLGGALKKGFDYATDLKELGLLGSAQVKYAIHKYTKELPEVIANRMKAEYDKKLGEKEYDGENIDNAIAAFKRQEKEIKDEFNNGIREASSTHKGGRAANRMKKKAEGLMLDTLAQLREEILSDDKYKSLREADDKKIAELEQKVSSELQKLKDDATNGESNEDNGVNPQEGDKIKLEDGSEKTVADMLIEVENGDGSTSTVNDEDVVSVEKTTNEEPKAEETKQEEPKENA